MGAGPKVGPCVCGGKGWVEKTDPQTGQVRRTKCSACNGKGR